MVFLNHVGLKMMLHQFFSGHGSMSINWDVSPFVEGLLSEDVMMISYMICFSW